MSVLLLTGRPAVGKTTAIRELVARLKAGGPADGTGSERFVPPRLAGFYTEEVRDRAGRRTGFDAVTFERKRVTIASVALPGSPRVSKYGVDVAAIDSLADHELDVSPDVDIYVVDEIGKMECYSKRFVARVRALLESGKPLVATVGQRGGGFIEEARRWPDAEVWEITAANRESVPGRAVTWLHRKGCVVKRPPG